MRFKGIYSSSGDVGGRVLDQHGIIVTLLNHGKIPDKNFQQYLNTNYVCRTS